MSEDVSMADDLLSKLERAEGLNRECVFALFELLEATDDQRAKIEDARRRVEQGELAALDILRWRAFEESHSFRALTSLDAALALVERVLPDAYYRFARVLPSERLGASCHEFWASCGPCGAQEEAYAPTRPLALCIALLRAVKASEQTP